MARYQAFFEAALIHGRSTREAVHEPKGEPSRESLFIQLGTLRGGFACEADERQQRMEALSKEIQETESRLSSLAAQHAALRTLALSRSLQVGVLEDQLRLAIESCAPIELAEFLGELDEELHRLRTMGPSIVPAGCELDHDDGRAIKRRTVWSDAASIQARTCAVMEARERALAMRGENLSVSDIRSELLALRLSLPIVVQRHVTDWGAAI